MTRWAFEPKSARKRSACFERASVDRSSGVFLSRASPVQLMKAVGMTSVVPFSETSSQGTLVGSHAV